MKIESQYAKIGNSLYGSTVQNWDEGKHPRADDGKFGSGGGGGGDGGGEKSGGDGGKVIPIKKVAETESGKPFTAKMKKADYKDFSKDDHADVARWHGQQQSNLSEKYHSTKNPDGTVSKKHMSQRAKIKKQIEAHVQQKELHRALYEGKPKSPDQKDFDRMDRKNDPQKRSKASNK